LPLVTSAPVGVVLIPQKQVGRVYSAIGGQPNVTVPLVADPVAVNTAVTVTTTDANVASVAGLPFIPSGQRSAAINIVTGSQGVATLTLFVGSARTQLV